MKYKSCHLANNQVTKMQSCRYVINEATENYNLVCLVCNMFQYKWFFIHL